MGEFLAHASRESNDFRTRLLFLFDKTITAMEDSGWSPAEMETEYLGFEDARHCSLVLIEETYEEVSGVRRDERKHSEKNPSGSWISAQLGT